jgi:hypothetical protein
MRIKKKYVIKEARLTEALMVDDLGNLTPVQKKILKSLHKKYVKGAGDDFRYWRLNSHDITNELHEKWKLSFQESFKLARLFVLHGDELFRENRISSDVKITEILQLYMDKFVKHYKESLTDEGLPGGDWDLTIGGEVTPHEPNFWDSYRGFNLYLPVNADHRWSLPRSERRKIENKLLLISVRFEFDRYGDTGLEPTVSIAYELGDTLQDRKKIEGHIVDKAYFDLPKEVSKEVMNKWFDDFIMNQVKPIVLDFKFPDPPLDPAED